VRRGVKEEEEEEEEREKGAIVELKWKMASEETNVTIAHSHLTWKVKSPVEEYYILPLHKMLKYF
jgi:hypothetical protein